MIDALSGDDMSLVLVCLALVSLLLFHRIYCEFRIMYEGELVSLHGAHACYSDFEAAKGQSGVVGFTGVVEI